MRKDREPGEDQLGQIKVDGEPKTNSNFNPKLAEHLNRAVRTKESLADEDYMRLLEILRAYLERYPTPGGELDLKMISNILKIAPARTKSFVVRMAKRDLLRSHTIPGSGKRIIFLNERS